MGLLSRGAMPYQKHSSLPRSPRHRCRCSHGCCPHTHHCAGRGSRSTSCHLKKCRGRNHHHHWSRIIQPPSQHMSCSDMCCENSLEGNGLSVTELLLRGNFSSSLPLSERLGAAQRQSLLPEDGCSDSGKRTELQFMLCYKYKRRLVF